MRKEEQQPMESLEDVELDLHRRFPQPEDTAAQYSIRALAIAGQPGHRSLTFNIDMSERFCVLVAPGLDEFVTELRARGFEVDELNQDISQDSAFDKRYWLIIYE